MPTQRPACSVRCHSRSVSASSAVVATSTSGGGCACSHARSSSRSSSRGARRRDVGAPVSVVTSERPSASGVNSRCRLLQAAEHVDRRVLVAAGAGRAVLGLRDRDVGHAVEEALEADARFGPGERRADTGVDAEPEPEVMAAVGAVEAELVRVLRTGAGRGSRRRCAPSRSCRRGCRRRRPWSATRDSRNSPWIGLSSRSISSMKFGMRSRSLAGSCWSSGRSAISCSAEPRSRAVVSPPAENRLAAISVTSCTSGSDPSGKVAVARPVITSSRGCAPALLDVRGEPVVEELQRLVRHRCRGRCRLPGRRAACPGAPRGTSSWSASGTPSRSAMTSSVKGFA